MILKEKAANQQTECIWRVRSLYDIALIFFKADGDMIQSMNLKLASDEELVRIFQNGESADYIFDEIVARYDKLIKSKARMYFIKGAEAEDVIQEGMIGLLNAVVSYQENRNSSFNTFAILCISRRIQDAVRKSLRGKHTPLNNYISIYSDDQAEPYGFNQKRSVASAEDEAIANELSEQIRYIIDNMLSKKEKTLFAEFLSGKSYKQISEKFKQPPKAIDNAIQRARKKIGIYTKGY